LLLAPLFQCGDERIGGATVCVRRRARKAATCRCRAGCDGTLQRGHGGARLDAKGGGEHRARDRFTQAREGSRQVAGRVQGDQGRGVLLPPLPVMMHMVPGHSEGAAARFGQARRRRPTRGGRAKAQPGLPGIDTRALGCAVTRTLGWRRASASANANASGSARRSRLDRHRTADMTTQDS
jgi:hypothetical protein